LTDDLRVLQPAVPRGLPCAIDFEGSTVRAFVNEPVAVALYAAGVRTLGRSTKFHRPRGLFCLEGHCASCFLRIDGRPNLRACMTPARPGLRCERQNSFPNAEIDLLAVADWMFPHGMDHHTLLTGNRLANRLLVSVVRQMGGSGTLPDAPTSRRTQPRQEIVDVCVVGAGPAGLTAAGALGRLAPRARVLLVDEQAEPGGSWLAEPGGVQRARAAADRARAAGTLLLTSATAIGFFPEDHVTSAAFDLADLANFTDLADDSIPGTLAVATPEGLIRIAARRFLYATGGYDQNLAFLDNDRPGVISARACGRLAFRHGVRPGRHVAIVGAARLGDRLAVGLAGAGVRADRIHRINPEAERPISANGATALRGLIVADADGRQRRIRADTIAVAAIPAPASELPRQHGADVRLDEALGGFAVVVDGRFQTSVAGVYACGDVAGYAGPDLAAAAGAAAATSIAHTLDEA
jgi:sarcosine oxidase subunit alpha